MNDFKQLDNFFTGTPRDRGRRLRFLNRLTEWLPSWTQFYYLPRVLSRAERYAMIILLLVALGSLLAIPISIAYHGTVAAPDYGGSWTEGAVGAPQHLNPLLIQTNDVDSDLTNLVFAGLLRSDGTGKLVPDLAESYSVSDDGLQYMFTLREELRWHDGQSLTADDVVFTILTAQNNETSAQRINWQGVDVEKKDDRTVVFKLRNRYAQFLNNATLGVIPKHVWENVKSSNFTLVEANIRPIGAGPYKFSKLRLGPTGSVEALDLVAFDKYQPHRPYIDGITFRFYGSEADAIAAFRRGDVDALSFVSPQKLSSLRPAGRIATTTYRLPRYFGIFFNQNKSKQLSDKKVRAALSSMTNKRELTDAVLDGKGVPVDSPLLPGIIDMPPASNSYPFNLDRARQLLDEADWKPSEPDGIRAKDVKTGTTTEHLTMEFDLTTSNWPELVAVANAIKEQWAQAGVRINVKPLTVPEVQAAIKERDYTMLLFGEVLGLDPDPFSFWHSSQRRDPGLNLALYDNKEADKILEEARQILDPATRRARYDKLQQIIMADVPVVLLYSPDYLYVRPKSIRGMTTPTIGVPSDRFDTVHEWYIDTRREKR